MVLYLKPLKNATGASVVFLINMSVIYIVYLLTSLPFVRERHSRNWTHLHTSAYIFGEKLQIHQKNVNLEMLFNFSVRALRFT